MSPDKARSTTCGPPWFRLLRYPRLPSRFTAARITTLPAKLPPKAFLRQTTHPRGGDGIRNHRTGR